MPSVSPASKDTPPPTSPVNRDMNTGWIVSHLAGYAVAGSPTPDAAIDTGKSLTLMPLRTRIAPVIPEELGLPELPPSALSIEDGKSPWWHASTPPDPPLCPHVDRKIRIPEKLYRHILTDASSQHLFVEAWLAPAAESILRQFLEGSTMTDRLSPTPITQAERVMPAYPDEHHHRPAPEGVQICRICRCWDLDACWNEDLGACWWVKPDLCSHCALKL